MTLNEKAKDLRSSGYALTVCGGAGLIIMILIFTGVIPVSLGGAFGIVTKCVMTLLFILFFAAGIHSFRRSKAVSQDAARETDKKKEIKKWFLESFDADALNQIIFSGCRKKKVPEDDQDGEEASAQEDDQEEIPAKDDDQDTETVTEPDAGEDEGGSSELGENDLYFERTDLIKDKICERFMDVEDALMSELTEEIYSELFEASE